MSTSIFRMSSGPLFPINMPCLGQCLDVGRDSKDKDRRHRGATGRCGQYALADCMQIAESSCARAKAVGETEVRCT
jgi:hypothetical protein